MLYIVCTLLLDVLLAAGVVVVFILVTRGSAFQAESAKHWTELWKEPRFGIRAIRLLAVLARLGVALATILLLLVPAAWGLVSFVASFILTRADPRRVDWTSTGAMLTGLVAVPVVVVAALALEPIKERVTPWLRKWFGRFDPEPRTPGVSIEPPGIDQVPVAD